MKSVSGTNFYPFDSKAGDRPSKIVSDTDLGAAA
jgi:hypothetical protein